MVLSFIRDFQASQYVISIKSSSLVHYTVELKWPEHRWDYENMFETGVVRANEY